MEIILLKDVNKVGDKHEIVSVKNGFGRNYLIPQGKAVPANEDNVKMFEARRAELEKKAAEVLTEAQSRAEKIAAVGTITIKANAGEEGKLFGSIGVSDIVSAAADAGFVPCGRLRRG